MDMQVSKLAETNKQSVIAHRLRLRRHKRQRVAVVNFGPDRAQLCLKATKSGEFIVGAASTRGAPFTSIVSLFSCLSRGVHYTKNKGLRVSQLSLKNAIPYPLALPVLKAISSAERPHSAALS